jgi:aryl-alcohol dehydrogenase-like predicted oxidoreductase
LAPQVKSSTELVDFFHAAEQLKAATDAAYGENDTRGRAQYEKYRHVLRHEIGGVERVSDLLGFLTDTGKAETIPEAAYRYCRYEPGMDSVLTGTGSVEHLKENIAALLKEPLPAADCERLAALFGRVDSVSGN